MNFSHIVLIFSRMYVANSSAKTSGGLFGNGLPLVLMVSLFMSLKRPLVFFQLSMTLYYGLLFLKLE